MPNARKLASKMEKPWNLNLALTRPSYFRIVCVLAVALLGALGCSGGEAVGKPSSVTEDQIREMDRAQEQVDAAEREHRKLNP